MQKYKSKKVKKSKTFVPLYFCTLVLFYFLLPRSAWGVTLVTDDFAGTANPLGGSWITQTSYVAVQKVSGRARGTNSGVTAAAYYNSAVAADQWAQATISTKNDVDNGGVGVMVRAASGADTFYSLKATIYLGVHYYALSKIVSGSGSDLYFSGESWVLGDVIRLEVQGTTLRMYRNGVQVSTDIPDSSIASGFVGITLDGVPDLATAELDDFSAGDFTTTPSVGVSRRVVGIQ